MIPKPYIAKWQEHAPWKQFQQVEQDLVISRALVEIFSDEFLKENLAFRGGTALHKLYLNPAPRYSEDIDLVQINAGPIKPIMERLKEVINFFEEPRQTQVKGHGAKALYRFASEYEGIRLRLKLEINCKEQFNLYQRSKGRDLFDLDYSRLNMELDIDEIIHCFKEYTTFATGNKPPSKREFLLNMEEKVMDPDFTGDMEALLRPEITYSQEEAFVWLKNEIIERI